MGQKVHPLGFRLGITKDWSARWFARQSYGKVLIQDLQLREFLKGHLSKGDVDRIEIERAGDNARLIIFSGKPGMVIGKKGAGIEALRHQVLERFGQHVEVSVQEVPNAALSATLVAANIAEQIERRASFKRVMKKSGFSVMKAGARGIKICCGGRLGGAEIARKEWLRLGSVPLHTLRADIDYASIQAKTIYGIVGVKVWICRGSY